MTPSPNNLARRKSVRLRLRPDLVVIPQHFQGRRHYIVKDPIRLRYYRFKEREHFILRQLNGSNTLDDVQQAYERHYRPQRLPLEEVEAFAQQVIGGGLAEQESPASQPLLERADLHRRQTWKARLVNLLALQIPLVDPDRMLNRLMPAAKRLFGRAFMCLSAALILSALWLVVTHFEIILARLPVARAFFCWQNAVFLWLTLSFVKVLHELGHALCCKLYGGEVHEMGAMLLCFSPCLYCDVSDSWTLPGKWQRIFISAAGIGVELLLAALATWVWWLSAAYPLIQHLSLCVMVVCSISTIVFNGNPLLRYDGYYALADWLEIPNLRDRSDRCWKRFFLEAVFGVRLAPEPYQSATRRVLFVSYAVTSAAYRWLVTFGVLWFLYVFLKPYRLGMVSILLASFAGTAMLGRAIYDLGYGLWQQRRRWANMNPRRIFICAGIMTVFIAAFFMVPLPVSRIVQVGLIEVTPEAQEQVYIHTPGILERLHVREGQQVSKGDVLAEFRSLDLENLRADTRAQRDIRVVQIQSLREGIGAFKDPMERGRLETRLTKLNAERAQAVREERVHDKMIQSLQIRAPRSGVVMELPRMDEVGKTWRNRSDKPFCRIGDPGRLWVVVPLDAADYRHLRDDGCAAGGVEKVPVTIRAEGRIGRRWEGSVTQLPETEAAEVPLALTSRVGGPIAVRPSEREQFVPATSQYLVAVTMHQPDAAVCPGTLAPVVFHCRWRTAAWWIWRGLSAAFELKINGGL